ncbi:hypothetical protein CJ483_21600 [Bacillus sp. PK3_68]|nr:hypothetical protein CJ483_21600 [Bacillus sp. PK3_68]
MFFRSGTSSESAPLYCIKCVYRCSPPRLGEAVCIVVSLREGLTCTSEQLIDFCKQRTSKYMIPKVVHFLDKFPLTPIGKIDKKALRKMFAEGILTI